MINFEAAKTGLRPEVYEALKRAQAVLPFAIRVTSTARPGGRSTSQHFSGNAADIGLRDLNDAQRIQLVRALINEGGFNRIGAYSGNTGLHVDMKPQRAEGGAPWPMFDKTRANMAMAPAWFTQGLRGFRGGVPMTVPVAPVAAVADTPPVVPARAPSAGPSPPASSLSGLASFLANPSGAALGLGAGMGLAAILGGGGSAAPDPTLAPEFLRLAQLVPVPPELPRPADDLRAMATPTGQTQTEPTIQDTSQDTMVRPIGRRGYRRGST